MTLKILVQRKTTKKVTTFYSKENERQKYLMMTSYGETFNSFSHT